MLLAIVGTRSSGKASMAEYYVKQGFTSVHILPPGHVSDNLGRDIGYLSMSESSEVSTLTNGETFTRNAAAHGRLSFLSMGNGALPSPLLSPNPLWIKSNQSRLYFSTPSELLDHVTKHWQQNFVTRDLQRKQDIQIFVKRPFFFLVSIDGPVMQRFHRSLCSPPVTLENFVQENDALLHGTSNKDTPALFPSLREIQDLIDIQINNSFSTLDLFHNFLDSLKLPDPNRLRPSWDAYFMTFASLASKRSNCMKRRVGAILVRDNRIVATGYNGTPRGLPNCDEGGCARCNGTVLDADTALECICLHAEENALLEAGRDRIGISPGTILYCNTCPCLKCTVKIIQTGVAEVVYDLSYKVDDASARIFKQAGVRLRRYPDQ